MLPPLLRVDQLFDKNDNTTTITATPTHAPATVTAIARRPASCDQALRSVRPLSHWFIAAPRTSRRLWVFLRPAWGHRGGIVGGALALRTDPSSPAGGVTLRPVGLAPAYRGKGLGRRLLQQVEAAARRLGALEISLGASGPERGFYPRLGYTGQARMRKQLPLSSAGHPEWRRNLEELRQRRRRRLAARQP